MRRISPAFFKKFLPWIVLAHAVVFVTFWLTNSLFYTSTNGFLAQLLKLSVDYIRILISISGGIAAWSLLRLVSYRSGWQHRLTKVTDWAFGMISVTYIAFFYGSFVILFRESPVQLPRIVQLLQYYRLILDPLWLLGAALILGLVVRTIVKRQQAGRKSVWNLAMLLPLGILAVLWAVPLVFPPGSVYRGSMPEKPRLIAHRGASMLAPENTLAAAQLASSLAVYGLETDLHISLDGQPFLMHDDTLKRTTNVKQVFPGRENERAETFTLAEVRQLNAGIWFNNQDPFGTIAAGKVTPSQVQAYQSQVVPTLAEELEVVRQQGLVFIFDLKQPPDGHPFNQAFFDIVFEGIKQAEIDPQVWYLVNPEHLRVIQAAAPHMVPVYGAQFQAPPAIADLHSDGYRIVNVEYGLPASWIRAYRSAGLWVNVYTIDEPWQFSRLWLLGVDSTTTSNAGTMAAMQRPLLALPYKSYVAIWAGAGLLGLIFLFSFGRMIKLLYVRDQTPAHSIR